jgi:preprotein translocase subunit YajC
MTSWIQVIAMAPPGGSSGGLAQMLPMMVIIFAIFYFMMIRPQQRKEKERKKMIEEIKSGTRVVFSGGILGTVSNVKDSTFTIKVADGVKLEVSRGAVSRVLEKGDKVEEA